jgi:Flp pilus assembly protein TadD
VLLASERVGPAIRHLNEVVRLDPDDAPALSDLGAALSMVGRVPEGLAYLRKAVERRPDFFLGRYNLAQALAAAGHAGDARVQFEAALRIKPDDPDVLQALKELSER